MKVETENLVTISQYAKITDTSQPTATRWAKNGKDKDGNPNALVVIAGVMFVDTKPVEVLSEITDDLLKGSGFNLVNTVGSTTTWELKTDNFATMVQNKGGFYSIEIHPNVFVELSSFQQMEGILKYLYGYNLEIKPVETPVF